jgi:uncharacterized Tic20 family protein
MDRNDDLRQLEEDHRMGVLSDEEFARRKAQIREERIARPPSLSSEMTPEARQWAMFIHLSVLAGYFSAGLGIVLPIILWQIKKDQLPGIDAHGKMVTNFVISLVIYTIVSALLLLVIIGFVLLPAVAIIGIIFPIIGGIKANNGELWKYPLTITFIK